MRVFLLKNIIFVSNGRLFPLYPQSYESQKTTKGIKKRQALVSFCKDRILSVYKIIDIKALLSLPYQNNGISDRRFCGE